MNLKPNEKSILLGFGLMALAACAGAGVAGDQAGDEKAGPQAAGPMQDLWIDTRLETAYLFNRHLNKFNIQTDVDDGAVLLTGTVRSEIDKDLAGEIARSLRGVTSVHNRLVVRESILTAARSDDDTEFGRRVDDATTTARVKTRLIVNKHLAGLKIDVDTTDSMVTLNGDVGTDEEKQLAELIAKNTPDVRAVTNELRVGDPG